MKKIMLIFVAVLALLLVACGKPTLTGVNSAYTFNVGDSITLNPSVTNSNDVVSFELEIIEGSELVSITNLKIEAIAEGNVKLKLSVVEKDLSIEISIVIFNPLKITGESTVEVNQTITLSANKSGISWESSNIQIATVSSSGVVTGKSPGNVKIIATFENEVVEHEVDVTDYELAIISNSNKVEVGKTLQLSANKSGVSWSSNSPNNASVSDTGLVTGLSEGDATIVATLGQEEKTIVIKVEKEAVLIISGPELVLYGESITLSTNQPGASWESSDESIATVVNGVVTGIGLGEVEIRATLGGLSDSVTIYVYIEELLLEGNNAMIINTTQQLVCINGVVWVTSDESIASVENGLVSAKKEGEVTISASIGQYEATLVIMVYATQLTINAPNNKIEVSVAVDLVVVDVLDFNQLGVSWSTSSSAIATVTASGRVTGRSVGNVTITATSRTNGASATVDIEVIPLSPTQIIVLNPPASAVFTDSIVNYSISILPTQAEKGVIWSSSDDRIAYVDNGLLIIDRPGTVLITVTSSYNKQVSDSFELTINYDVNKLVDDIMMQDLIVKRLYANYNAPSDGGAYSRQPMDQYSSVSKYYFGVIPNITVDYKRGSYAGENGAMGVPMPSLEFVCVHDTGTSLSGSWALNNHNYGKNITTQASWHYTVGNDGIWQMLPETDLGWHAGDGTGTAWTTIDTGVSANGSLRQPKITVNWTTRTFVVNGQATSISVPSAAPVNSPLPATGIFCVVGANGNWWMSNTWASSGFSNYIAHRGGNRNSIGIESAVNTAGDLYLTWHYLAWLVADILIRNDMDFDRVLQHNSFSQKDCPMTLRGNGLWPLFMDMVKSEYYVRTLLIDNGYKLAFETSNSAVIKLDGRVNIPSTATTISTKVTITNPNSVQTQKTYTYTVPTQ